MARYVFLGCFVLIAAGSVLAQTSTDSLGIMPSQPTTADSITLTVLIPNRDCCIRNYSYDSVANLVSDTMVQLPYQLRVIACPQIICNPIFYYRGLPFKCAPLSAGTYAVYENMGFFGPSSQLVKIGSFTVTTPTSTVHQLSPKQKVTGRITGNMVRYYTLRGELIAHPNNRGHGGRVIVMVDNEGPAAVVANPIYTKRN